MSSDEEPSQSRRGSSSRHPTGTAKRKRYSAANLEELFEKQDEEEKRRLGREYRELQVEADDLKANLANVSTAQIMKQMRKQEELFREVRDTGTATLDARSFITNTDTAMSLARKMKVEGNAFDVDEFLIRVKAILGLDRIEADEVDPSSEDELDDSQSDDGARRRRVRKGPLGNWDQLGWRAAKLCRRVPGVEFMYGPLKVEHKKRTATHRRRRRSLPPETRPDELVPSTQKGATRDETTVNVTTMRKTLARLDPAGQGVNLFQLIVHPQDFAQTVENAFYASFLIRENKAAVEVMADGQILIRAIDPPDESEGEVVRNQAVIEIDMTTWREAIRVYNLREPEMPHRDYSHLPGLPAANGRPR